MAGNPTPPAYLTFSWLLDLETYEFEGSPHISMRIFVMDTCDFYILAQRAARKTSAMKDTNLSFALVTGKTYMYRNVNHTHTNV